MAIGRKPGLQALQDRRGGRCVDVMEEAVHEDEVKASLDGLVVIADVCDNELTIVLFPGVGDVTGIDIDAEIVGVGEEVGVGAGAAADVQDAAGAVEGVMGEQGRQLCGGKRRLPQAVDEGLLEQIVEDAHRERARCP